MSVSPTSREPVIGRFRGKVALVTGATHGIGFAIALELLREGATVVASGLPFDAEEGTAAFASAGFSPLLVSGDLGTASFCNELVSAAVAFGGRIDYLVNNAFSFLSRGMTATTADFERSNAVGPVAFATLIQQCVPHMRKVGGGAIVNVSSISAWVAQPDRWTYNMAKGAVTQLTRCAALDLAPFGIRVNSVSPAWTWTREVAKAAGKSLRWGLYCTRLEMHVLGRSAGPCVARSQFFGPPAT